MNKIFKRILLGIITFIMMLTLLPTAALAGESDFEPRLSAPSSGNSYYNRSLNIYSKQGYGMPNCTAYAYGNFHQRFIRNHITLIGCPKLDEGDYTEKLTAILRDNSIKSLTIVRMEVPCCGGIENAAKNALQKSGKFIPWQVFTISTNGKILE